jgi:hypothetical protein
MDSFQESEPHPPWSALQELRFEPSIVESYRDFQPPENFRRTIETLLRYVPRRYLVGLRSVVLTNRAGLTTDQRKRKVWSRNRKVRLADTRGAYSYQSNSSPATVWLYVDNICSTEPSWWRKVALLRYMVPSDVLYHEIGHHIHAVHEPTYKQREDVANYWRRELWRRFLRKHYWYLFPVLNVFTYLMSPIIKRAKWRAARP